MSKHTPAPWTFVDGFLEQDKKVYDYWVRGADKMGICEIGHRHEPVANANARLIASAPELLEALKALVDRTNPNQQPIYNFMRKDWERAVVAITKAEGTNMKDPKDMSIEELTAEYLRLGKKIDDIPFEKKANQDFYMYTNESLYALMAKSANPKERFELSQHLLWVHDDMLDVISKCYGVIRKLEDEKKQSQTLLSKLKANIRKRATKPRVVRRRGLV
jgi:hypothetical protein